MHNTFTIYSLYTYEYFHCQIDQAQESITSIIIFINQRDNIIPHFEKNL